MNNQTLQSLRQLKLTGMADGFEQQLAQPSPHSELDFDERLALLVEASFFHINMSNPPASSKAPATYNQTVCSPYWMVANI